MTRVKAITKEQIELARQADGPQKNSLHGRYKNGIMGEIKRLEEERNDIMRSLLKDGHDPELTTIDEAGAVTRMKLSEYMTQVGIPFDKPETKKNSKSVENIGKYLS